MGTLRVAYQSAHLNMEFLSLMGSVCSGCYYGGSVGNSIRIGKYLRLRHYDNLLIGDASLFVAGEGRGKGKIEGQH